MREYEVPEPILNSPYDEPKAYWLITEGGASQGHCGQEHASHHPLHVRREIQRDS